MIGGGWGGGEEGQGIGKGTRDVGRYGGGGEAGHTEEAAALN